MFKLWVITFGLIISYVIINIIIKIIIKIKREF
jgi:hypothetical protein